MKTSKVNLILIAIFISITGVIGMYSDIRVMHRFFNKISRITNESSSRISEQSINVSSEKADTQDSNSQAENLNLQSTTRTLNSLITKMNETYEDEILGKMHFIELDGYVQKLLNKHVVQDADETLQVIKDSKGYLYTTLTESMTDPVEQVSNLKNLYKFCQDKHIDFLYVQAPSKVNDEQTKLPQGIVDYTGRITQKFIKRIDDAQIPYLDLASLLVKEESSWEKAFFITDHHWTFETAFWANQKIINEINQRYSYKLDKELKFTNKSYYDTYSEKFVGSQGKRVGQYYTNTDIINLYVPKFKTDLNIKIFNEQHECMLDRSGRFYGTLINKDMFEDKNIYGEKYLSCLETNQETIICNNDSPNQKKVLFIKDSYARPVAAYLSLNVKETRLIDLRQYSGSIAEYINNYNPNIVIILYNNTAVPDKSMYAFN